MSNSNECVSARGGARIGHVSDRVVVLWSSSGANLGVRCPRGEKVRERDGVTAAAAAWRAHQQLSRQPWGESRCDQAASQPVSPRRRRLMSLRRSVRWWIPRGPLFSEGVCCLSRGWSAPSALFPCTFQRAPARPRHIHNILGESRSLLWTHAAFVFLCAANERAPEAQTATRTRPRQPFRNASCFRLLFHWGFHSSPRGRPLALYFEYSFLFLFGLVCGASQ